MKEVDSKSIRKSYTGGPHNLGDPNNQYLRKVEKDVLIPQKMRDKAKAEKCVEQVKEFTECCKNSSLLMVFKCRKQNSALKDCLATWYNNADFKEECTREYLQERSEYRRTGVPKTVKNARVLTSM